MTTSKSPDNMMNTFKYHGWDVWGRTAIRCFRTGKGRLSAWANVMATISLAWVAVLFLCWPTVQTLIDVWTASRTFAHGFLILPATLYLVWSYRERLVGVTPTRSAFGASLFALLAWSWWDGHLREDVLWQQASMVAMLPALILALCGTGTFRILCFPLGLLVFALPIGTAIEGWLQDFTTAFLVVGLKAVGVPLLRDGYFISIPSGRWEVATDCAGLRYVLPGLALGYMYAVVMYRRAVCRIWFLLLCSALLILANGLRAYGIIVGDHLGIAEGTDHRAFSYTIYAVTIILLAWVGHHWGSAVPDTSVAATNVPREPVRGESHA